MGCHDVGHRAPSFHVHPHIRRLFSVVALALVLFAARVTHAQGSPAVSGDAARFGGELGHQVLHLKKAWAKLGEVEVLSPALLERGASHGLALSARMLDPATADCATLVVLAATNISYLITFGDQSLPITQRAWPVPSAAGVAEITRCGTRKRLFGQLVVQMRSRRGILEFLLLQSTDPPGPTTLVLRGRDPGPSLSAPQVGPRPHLLPLGTRLASKRAALMRSGAHEFEEIPVQSDETGRGELVLQLKEGCHRLTVLAPQDKTSPPDIDARLVDVAHGEILGTDDEQSGEASLFECNGRLRRVRIEYSGSNPTTNLVLLHARFELVQGVPSDWGTEARASIGQALREANIVSPSAPPLFATLGVRGETSFTFHAQPKKCYVFVAAPVRGESKRLALRATFQLRERHAQAQWANQGAVLSFCVENEEEVQLMLHSVGTAVAWVMGVWTLGDNNGDSPPQ